MSANPPDVPDADETAGDGPSGVTPVRSVARAVDILLALGSGPRPLGDLSSEVVLSKATTYRILSTLRQKGMVLQNECTGEYRLGPACFRMMSSVVDGRAGFPFDADTELQELRNRTSETITVHVRAGLSRLCIQELPSPQAIRYISGLGATEDIHVGSAGKVLLAFMDPDERENLLSTVELRPTTPSTITSMAALRAELDAVRERGTAYSHGERVVGAVGVSAPILDDRGVAVASLSVLSPATRVDDARLREFDALARETAEKISRRMHRQTGAPHPGAGSNQ